MWAPKNGDWFENLPQPGILYYLIIGDVETSLVYEIRKIH